MARVEVKGVLDVEKLVLFLMNVWQGIGSALLDQENRLHAESAWSLKKSNADGPSLYSLDFLRKWRTK